MMQQFLAAKRAHPDAIVFFRMGDFYETFFEDAVVAAELLELTLTSRNKKDSDPIPMAGVPHHAAKGYIRRLLAAGRKVAVCEQMEDPRKAKGLVRRDVVQVVTPGVVLDDEALDRVSNNYLAALWRAQSPRDGQAARSGASTEGRVSTSGPVGLAWVDASTGEVHGATLATVARAADHLARIEPAEVLVSQEDDALAEHLHERLGGGLITRVPEPAQPDPPEGPGAGDAPHDAQPAPLDLAHAMARAYVARTQRDRRLPLRPLEPWSEDQALGLGADAVRNLELLRTLHDGEHKGSLVWLLDRCKTAMGSRLLRQWLLSPLLDPARIRQRHEVVGALVDDLVARSTARDSLRAVYDLERLVTRVAAGTASPRDLVALASSLERVPELAQTLASSPEMALRELAQTLNPVPEVVALIRRALVDEPPPNLREGGVIREGFDPALDELLVVARDGKEWFQRYAAQLREETGISSLKIRFNQVFGYFLEVTRANLQHVPDTWLRRQTLANSERYYTPELKEREELVLSADDRRAALEEELFERLRADVAAFGAQIQATARAVARVDVFAALADLASERGYVRPTVDDGLTLRVVGGRHPVIEALLPAGEFIPNDVELDADEAQLVVITGPNMAGKSTVMRQTALIAILAQMGSFVPAEEAHVGVVDRVFTRVGASDNLTRGASTFMVEMTEAAAILQEATRRSLVVIDEIGRGTSTYDGVSIAWAVAEHLHDVIGARTLFATHYHELTELAATRPRVVNMSIAVREWQDDIVFLRRLVPGGTNRSYGIQVARLAGLDERVIARAKEVLANLERGTRDPSNRPRLARHASGARGRGASHPGEAGQAWQLSLFSPADLGAPGAAAVAERLQAVDADTLTPRKALDLVYELQDLLRG